MPDREEEHRKPEEILQGAGAQQHERRGEHEGSGKMMEHIAEIRGSRVRRMPGENRHRPQIERIVIVAAGARDVRVGDGIHHEKCDDDER